METKGKAVKSIAEYVKNNFADKYVEWVKRLSLVTYDIINNSRTNK